MVKILTQDEIDALLTTVSGGKIEADSKQYSGVKMRSVAVYDFKHPNRLSKNQIRTLENMHEFFAGHLSSVLSSVLHTVVDIDLVSVDQITYSEFIMSLATPSCTYTFAAAPLDGVCLVDFNPTLTFSIIDRMFGGHGKIMETGRELTRIERTVMTPLVGRLYGELAQSWQNLVPIEVEQKSFESDPQFIQIVPPGETVVVISFQVKVFQSTGRLTICYPYVSLEPIVTRLSAQNWTDATRKKNLEHDREANLHNLGKVSVEVAAVLLKSKLKMKRFLQLRAGDIVSFQKKINQPIEVTINCRKKFVGRPGLRGRKRAFQVLEVVDNMAEEFRND